MARWVRRYSSDAGYVDLDKCYGVLVDSSGSGPYKMLVQVPSVASAITLDGTYATVADAEDAARQLVQGSTVAELL